MEIQNKSVYETMYGNPHPLGATVFEDGVNFSIFSDHASSVELLLFTNGGNTQPFQIIKFDPIKNRTFSFWHIFVKDLKPGTHYVYRVDGPRDKMQGYRFNPRKALLDPYARGYSDTLWDRVAACGEEDNLHCSMRSVVIDYNNYDWEGDKHPNRPIQDMVIYEMHVRGFTKSPTANVENNGTFAGIIEKIPYLKQLGITTIELLPIFEFDRKEVLKVNDDGQELKNFWGYSTVGFFAPDSSYTLNPEIGNHINEFRDMVKALHREGIDVILDVVFNHTNEGNHQGPTISFRGLDNLVYYYLVKENKQYYMDYTGCGNTFNVNHPIVEKLITDCLEFWVKEMHVDGFRFDEGSILSRDEDGKPTVHPPLLWNIELSETLADTKLITEAWDAAGLYQIGSFPGYRWAEWNGLYRDTLRRFIRGDDGMVNALASRIAGSADIYDHNRHSPINSINFVTCHDGFTLMDLVSYNEKHNFANGEGNMDGIDENLSANGGIEGETNNPAIKEYRQRQIKNFLSLLLVSQGIPMILAGDEFGRTQKGNNNAYCQDNEISWIDWTLLNENSDLFKFFQRTISLRRSTSSLRRKTFYNGSINKKGLKDIEWHGCKLYSPGWNNPLSHVLAFTIASFVEGEPDLHVIANMEIEHLEFEIPPLPEGYGWQLFLDTSKTCDNGNNSTNIGNKYNVKSHSVVILCSYKV